LLSFLPLAYFPDGRAFGRAGYGTIESIPRPDGSSTPMTRRTDTKVVVATAAGAVTVLADWPDDFSLNVQRDGGQRMWGVPIPFRASRLEAVSQNSARIATVTTSITSNAGGTFTIVVLDARGDSVLSKTYPFAGTPVTRNMADSAARAAMASYRGDPARNRAPTAPADVADEIESKMRSAMPPVTAPIRNLVLGLDNSIWLALPRTDPGAGSRYLVLDERGEPWRTVTLPAQVRYIAQVSRTSIWAGEWDADGLASIVRFRVTR
jgi:hypothetical protein